MNTRNNPLDITRKTNEPQMHAKEVHLPSSWYPYCEQGKHIGIKRGRKERKRAKKEKEERRKSTTEKKIEK